MPAAAPLSARSASAAGAAAGAGEPFDTASTLPTSPPRASAAAVAPPTRRIDIRRMWLIRGTSASGSLRSADGVGSVGRLDHDAYDQAGFVRGLPEGVAAGGVP